MEKIEEFYEKIKKEEEAVLATGTSNSVTMRTISPVYYDKKILFFTDKNSKKYNQLKENPNCCLYIDNFFVEAKAEFYGSTMNPENQKLKETYIEKFSDAFDENAEYGGITSDFIILTPTKIYGWDKTETGLIPFNITLNN